MLFMGSNVYNDIFCNAFKQIQFGIDMIKLIIPYDNNNRYYENTGTPDVVEQINSYFFAKLVKARKLKFSCSKVRVPRRVLHTSMFC